jgi:hypothetical protein
VNQKQTITGEITRLFGERCHDGNARRINDDLSDKEYFASEVLGCDLDIHPDASREIGVTSRRRQFDRELSFGLKGIVQLRLEIDELIVVDQRG